MSPASTSRRSARSSSATKRVVVGSATIPASCARVGGGAERDSCGKSVVIASRSAASAEAATRTVITSSPGLATPHRLAHAVVEDVARSPLMAAKTCSPHRSEPTSGCGILSRVNQPTSLRLQRMRRQPAHHGPAVEEQRVQGHPGEAEPQAVEDRDEAHRLDDDAGLLLDLLHHDLGRRIAHVAPPGRVQPDARVRPLDQQQLPLSLPTAAPTATLGVT